MTSPGNTPPIDLDAVIAARAQAARATCGKPHRLDELEAAGCAACAWQAFHAERERAEKAEEALKRLDALFAQVHEAWVGWARLAASKIEDPGAG